jgi:hypothetical protein
MFNKQLKEQLKNYEQSISPRVVTQPPVFRKRNEPSKRPESSGVDKARVRVVGGDILWKPIDRTAAMVIRRAPWWAKPPACPEPVLVNNPKAEDPAAKIRTKRKPMSDHKRLMLESMETVEKLEKRKTLLQFCELTCNNLMEANKLTESAMDARAAMDVMCDQWKTSWLNLKGETEQALKDLRLQRMAMDSETRQLMAQLKEVRTFFLDSDYEKERARLKEFIELCERLKALKESGFLDTVADTMLNLSK